MAMLLQVSTHGDLYSFGILLLEMLTGRRPTEEMFKDGHNLHNYVKIASPNKLLKIVDSDLLPTELEQLATVAEEENNVLEIVIHHLNPNVEKCLVSLFRIGLACSVESPRQRMNMVDVTRELRAISNAFIAGHINKICLPHNTKP